MKVTTYFIRLLLLFVCLAGSASGQPLHVVGGSGGLPRNTNYWCTFKLQQYIDDLCPPENQTGCKEIYEPVFCLSDQNLYGNCCEACNQGQNDCYMVTLP